VASTEEPVEAAVAVRLIALLFERAFLQLFQAVGADEVLRVELAEHGRYTAPSIVQIHCCRSCTDINNQSINRKKKERKK